MTLHALAQRRRVLFAMLMTLGFHYPPGRVPPVIAGIRQYLEGWSGIGRMVAGMAPLAPRLAAVRQPLAASQWSLLLWARQKVSSGPSQIQHSRVPPRPLKAEGVSARGI